VAELECPRLFLLLPQEAPQHSRLKRLLHRVESVVKDKYRLVFLDPVTGCYVRTGPEGDGYHIELPQAWLMQHHKRIADGLTIIKWTAALGRIAGLPLPSWCVPCAE
jgi:hypothetical protein